MIKILNSDVKFYSAETIYNNILTKYNTEKNEIRKILQVLFYFFIKIII
jgi:hypothetical protein